MSKEEFLRELEKSLKGKVDDREIARQLQYYESYINNEINAGRSIEDVMKELGSPRLIAKTIIQTYSIKDNPINRNYAGRNYGYEEAEDNAGGNIKSGLWKAIAIVCIFAVLMLVLGIIFSVLKIVMPVVVMVIAAYIIFKLLTQ